MDTDQDLGDAVFDLVDVRGFVPALRGARLSMRTELEIWAQVKMGDSYFKDNGQEIVGPQDMELAHKLIRRGTPHDKFMWNIDCWFLMRATRYWLQQFATYRIGVEVQSASTMHTLSRGVTPWNFIEGTSLASIEVVQRDLENKDFYAAKKDLPEGYLQTRMVKATFGALRRIVCQRILHRLPEWQDFIRELHAVRYADDLIFYDLDLSKLE